ncbi:MAG: PEP-CTERM sorting domain-containing protein [Thermoguttaceae bacterium]|nr:PEP-CTERM sorting domain-containing protein [Thermoguttaceae bacterium]
MIKSSNRVLTCALLLTISFFANVVFAEVVYYNNEFNVDRADTAGNSKWTKNGSLAPFYSNLRFYHYGGEEDANFRRSMGATNNLLSIGKSTTNSDQNGYVQIDASTFLSSVQSYDLSAGDLVYEAAYTTDNYHENIGSFYNGITINNEKLTFIYHPGYSDSTTKGAFRVHLNRSTVVNNQDIGFIPPVGDNAGYTLMKLTIHQNNETGKYDFTTQMGLASTGYTYTYTYSVPISQIGTINSIGPYAHKKNNMHIDYIHLQAPFADVAVASAKQLQELRDMFVTSDKPVHWYKFDDPSTNVIKDYGSNPKNGTATNVDMSAISELNQVADFSGKGSKVSILDSPPINGPWTAEFLVNTAQLSGNQSLLADNTYSLRLTQSNSPVPGYTHYNVLDYKFLNPDGGSFDSSLLSSNEWLHVTFVNDGNNMLFYLNGELAGISNEELIPLPTSYIGTGKNGSGDNFVGMMDYMALYNYALSAEQIWAHAHPTPEPATWALMILGIAGLMYVRKRKN